MIRLQELIFELYPLILEVEGLPNTISALSARLQARTGIDGDFGASQRDACPRPVSDWRIE